MGLLKLALLPPPPPIGGRPDTPPPAAKELLPIGVPLRIGVASPPSFVTIADPFGVWLRCCSSAAAVRGVFGALLLAGDSGSEPLPPPLPPPLSFSFLAAAAFCCWRNLRDEAEAVGPTATVLKPPSAASPMPTRDLPTTSVTLRTPIVVNFIASPMILSRSTSAY